MKHYYFTCDISFEVPENRKRKGSNLTILVDSSSFDEAQKLAELLIQKRPNYSGKLEHYNLTLLHLDEKKTGMIPLKSLQLRDYMS